MTASLPADIPTLQEILASKDVLFQHNCMPCKVVRVRNYAIKIRPATQTLDREPDNLRYLSQFPGLNVPKCYAAFEDSSAWPFDKGDSARFGANICYVIADFIAGDTLEHRWESLSAEQRIVVQEKLREQVRILSSIRSPELYFGEFPNRPYTRGIFGRHFEMGGPYTKEEDLMNHIATSINMDVVRDKDKYRVEFTKKVLRESSLFRGSEPVLRVSDFQPKNVMITVVGRAEDEGEYDLEGDADIIVSLIDWETLMWVPEWLEYCEHAFVGDKEPEWWTKLLIDTLEPSYGQLSWWRIVKRYT